MFGCIEVYYGVDDNVMGIVVVIEFVCWMVVKDLLC